MHTRMYVLFNEKAVYERVTVIEKGLLEIDER